jgi:predicted ATP-dependent endonuclease of OLD family
VSTHSPILVDEAKYGETVLVRNHRFFAPSHVSDETRAAINTALLAGHGAEMAFASSVLLVEGGGDRAYYEVLRRRLARVSGDGRLDHLAIVPVGSKSAFAPWVQMLTNYGIEGDRPIRWLIAADGDAATQVRQAYGHAGIRLPASVRSALFAAANARNDPDQTAFVAATELANRRARAERVWIHLSPIDLEHTALTDCSDDRAAELAGELGLVATNRAELEVALRNRKAAYRRADLAERLAWTEVSADTKRVLRTWFRTVMSETDARRIVSDGDSS